MDDRNMSPREKELYSSTIQIYTFLGIVLLLFLLIPVFSINVGGGSLSGKLIKSSWEGLMFKSCEIEVQFGDQSSRIKYLSTKEKAICDNAKLETKVTIKYNKLFFKPYYLGSKLVITELK